MMHYQLWQHAASGLVFVVATAPQAHLTPLAATGPLQPRQYERALCGDWDGDANILALLRQADTADYRLLEWRR